MESFPVSRVIRARTVVVYLYRFVRPNVPIVPSRGLLLSCGGSRPVFFGLADLPQASIYDFLIKQPSLEFIEEKWDEKDFAWHGRQVIVEMW